MEDRQKKNAALLSVVSNSLQVAAKFLIGILTGSVSILSEAAHSDLDLVAAGIAWFSIHEAGKPAGDQHRFGHGKYENVAGTAEALLIFAVGFSSSGRRRESSPPVPSRLRGSVPESL